jgi:hypothetical protein
MPKTTRSHKKEGHSHHQAGKGQFFSSVPPWKSRPQSDHSEILAYSEAGGAWETVLDVRQTSGACHERMAASILALIHEHQEKQNALHCAMEALELVMADGLTYSSEQLAERALSRIKNVISG